MKAQEAYGIPLINSGRGNVQRKIDGASQMEGCKTSVQFFHPLCGEALSYVAFGTSETVVNGGKWT